MKLDVKLVSPAGALRSLLPRAQVLAGRWPARASVIQTAGLQWLGDRSRRERWLIALLSGVLIIVMLDRLIWHPLTVARSAAISEIARDDSIAAQLEAAGPDVARIAAARSGTLSTIVTERAARAGLTIARIEPQGPTVVVSLNGVSFDALVDWLAALDREAGINVVELKIDRRPDPGIVAAQVTLTER